MTSITAAEAGMLPHYFHLRAVAQYVEAKGNSGGALVHVGASIIHVCQTRRGIARASVEPVPDSESALTVGRLPSEKSCGLTFSTVEHDLNRAGRYDRRLIMSLTLRVMNHVQAVRLFSSTSAPPIALFLAAEASPHNLRNWRREI